FTLRLESVVELEDGFVLTGRLSWDDSAFPTGDGGISVPVLPTLTDAGGQVIPIEEVRMDALYGDQEMPWSFRTNRKIFSGPLVLGISTIGTVLFPPDAAFEIDLGLDPQIGQSWAIDRDFDFAGHTVSLISLRLRESPDSCWQSALEFRFASDEPGVSADVQDVNLEPPCLPSHGGGGGGGGPPEPGVFNGVVAYQGLPMGLHRFSISASIPYVIDGPWEVAWQPPLISGPTPTPEAEACLTHEAWTRALSQVEALPADLGGRLLVSLDVGGLTPMPVPAPDLPPLQLVNLDGTNRQNIPNGGSPALSPDGNHLIYNDQGGFHSLDLSTGQDSLLGVDGYAPIWSPDGSQILYTSFPGLSVMQADGSGSHEIDVGAAEITQLVGWLPANQTIIYSVMTGEGFTFVMRNLQSGETRELFSVHNKWGSGALSPDGQWIATLDRVFGAPPYGVFVSRLDGSERKLVAAPGIPISYHLAWSPDGRWLLVNTQDYRQSDPIPEYRPVLIELSTCRAIALPDAQGYVEGWVR
ncbi:MAG: TolB family protein, partial [Anaerolineales bacterium]